MAVILSRRREFGQIKRNFAVFSGASSTVVVLPTGMGCAAPDAARTGKANCRRSGPGVNIAARYVDRGPK